MTGIYAMNFQTLDLNLLRVLDAMLAERNTTRVGERIGLSQPAISAALNRLRHALGDPLFVRVGNAMVPTPYAETLREPLRQAIEQIEAALLGNAPFDPVQSRRCFRIFGSDFFSEMLLPQLLTLLTASAPNMQVQLLHQDPGTFVTQLGDERIDLALMPPETTPEWVERQIAFHSTFVAVASSQHDRLRQAGIEPGSPIPIDLFCDIAHVLFAPEGNTSGMEDDALAAIGRQRRVFLTVPEFYSVGRAVAQSQLLAILPSRFALSLAERLGLTIHPLSFPMPMARLYLYWHRRHSESGEHRWMRQQILDRLAPLDEINFPISLGIPAL